MFYAKRITSIVCFSISVLIINIFAEKSESNIEGIKKVNETNRPQEPRPPYPYKEEEVTYQNGLTNLTLSGTLTIPYPQELYPVVILISGMGPNDRNYTMLGHKLFLLLADYLTRQGIAVLRFDKRGVGKSTGKFDTTLTSEDFASDVLAGVQYLKTRKEIKSNQIGLIGHSEGGLIASIVAAKSNDIAFLVLMAGAVATSTDNIIEQTGMQLHADGATNEMIALDSKIRKQLLSILKQEANYDVAEKQLHSAIAKYLEELTVDQKNEATKLLFAINGLNFEHMLKLFNSSWYRYFLGYNPITVFKKVKAPVLAINGDLDFITSSKITLPIIEQALKNADNKNYTTLELPKLNHWFQTCKTGSISEYGVIEETISPVALNIMAEWVLKLVN